jgi:hypothetical protein
VLLKDDFVDHAYQPMIDEGWLQPFNLHLRIEAREKLLSTSVESLEAAVKRAREQWQRSVGVTATGVVLSSLFKCFLSL